jgi:hypothetical protein
MVVYSKSHRRRVSRLCGQKFLNVLGMLAVSWLSQSPAYFSRRPGLICRPVQVGFLFDEVSLGRVFFPDYSGLHS